MFWLGLGVGVFVGFLVVWFIATTIATIAAWMQIRENELDD